MEETLNILVVDDDAIDRMAMRRALIAAGVKMQLSEVETCAAAIDLLQQQSFDCVFLDCLLPDADGLTLVRSIQAADIKVALVVLTGQGDERVAVELMKAGVSDYLSKGRVSPETLSRSLQSAIRINRAEIAAAEANQKLQDNEERFRSLVQNSSDMIAIMNRDGTARYVSPSSQRILGYPPEALIGQQVFHYVHPQDLPTVQKTLMATLYQAGITAPVQVRFRHLNGSWVYLESVANNLLTDPTVQGVIVNSRDITERKQLEEALKLGQESQRFLAEASTLLSTSLDYHTTLQNLAHLSIPALADWCTIHVAENGTLKQIAVAHVDPHKAQWLHELQRRYPLDLNVDYGIPKVVRTGEPDFFPQVPESLLQMAAQGEDHLTILHELGFYSSMCIPLIARGRTLGAVTFVLSKPEASYSSADLVLAEDLARRAALAVDNARLYGQAQEVGENLRQAIVILGQQQQQLRTLQRLTNLLNQRLRDLPGLLQTIVRSACNTIPDAQFGFIALHNPHQQRLELTARAGAGVETLEIDGFPYGRSGFLETVFSTGEAQLLQGEDEASDETEQHGLHPLTQLPDRPHPASVYAVAIESAQAGRLGILTVGHWENPSAFEEEDRRLLVAFGEQAAIAINNARLINTLEEREGRLALQNDLLTHQNLELERQRQQIQLQNLKLLEAAQLKSQFLATMSHELRTPMNAIIGFSQLLLRQQRYKLVPQQMDMVERIFNNGKNLLMLINDILDLSKIEAGHLQLTLEEFNLPQLIQTTVEELRSLAEQKSLQLEVTCQFNHPRILNDSARLRQVLVNLLSNAIKFTEVGGVTISAWEVAENQLVIAVQDTGIGIAETDLPHIFEEFRQVDQSLTKKYGGTGLGLSITDWLVRMMGGSIQVESQLGVGSTFRVEIPRQVQNESVSRSP